MKIRFRCPPELRALLPEPYLAKRGLPEWLRAMPDRSFSADIGSDIRTVKHCPPFIDAMGAGFIIPLATDVRVHEQRFEWSWDLGAPPSVPYPRSPLMFHLNEQLAGAPFRPQDRAALKFTNFWTIETEPGCSLLVTHPLNREELPFRTLSGLVDTDTYTHGSIQFPALWLDPAFSGVLAKGTPIAQCIPVRRDRLELELGELAGEDALRFEEIVASVGAEPGVYRKRFRVAKP